MSKSKKNKKSQKKTKQRPIPEKIRFIDAAMNKIIMNPQLLDGDIYESDIPISNIGKDFRSIGKDQVPNFSEKSMDNPSFMNSEHSTAEIVTKLFSEYYGKHIGLDKTLNKYHKDSDWQITPDIIDFREFMKETYDPLTNALRYVLKYKDPAMLWTPSEYTCIQLTDSMTYLLRREDYDAETHSVTYTGVLYAKRILIKNAELEMPVLSFKIKASVDNTSHIKDFASLESAVLDFYKIELEDSVDVNNMPVCLYDIIGSTPLWTVMEYCKKYWKNRISNDSYKCVIDILARISNDFYLAESEMTLYMYLRQYISIALACIIITNGYIIEEKMSRPVKDSVTNDKPIKHIAASSDNQPDKNKTTVRKTRHLGSNLKITTHSRPARPTVEKIIRYTKSEWGRRGYVRHYKSGKTVQIAPVTVHRKCVDMSDVKSQTQQGVKYVIHPDKSK